MKTKTVIAAAVVLVVILFAAIFFTFLHKPPQVITVRHVKSVQLGKVTTLTFEITNHTEQTYLIDPHWVQARNGLAWPITDKSSNPFFCYPFLSSHRSVTATFNMTNLPAGSPLRLRMMAGKDLPGLEGMFFRLDLRFRQGQNQVSVNPFDKKTKVASSTLIFSDEFVAPEPELTSKANVEK